MKAWLLDSLSGLSALRLSDSAPTPSIGPDEVLVRVHYAALNPADRFLAENLYPARPSLPHILGRDGCGTIEQVGANVQGLRVGDVVTILRNEVGVERPGTFAELVAVPADWVVLAPKHWSLPQAGCASLVYLTAHQALNQWGRLPPGYVLITGASGGVGLAAIHLAKAEGHQVIALSRGTAKRDRLQAEGAELVLDPGDEQLKEKVRSFTGRSGVQLAVDNIGGPLFDRVIDTLCFRGCISVVGMLGGSVPQFNTARLLFKRVRVGGVLVFDYTPQTAKQTWGEILSGLERIGKKPVVARIFPFTALGEAFEHLARGPFGKVVLEVRADETARSG